MGVQESVIESIAPAARDTGSRFADRGYMSQDWPRVLSASVVPVVIISACGLLCLAFYNRLASVVSRLRGFQRERLAEQERLSQPRRVGEHEPEWVRRRELVLDMLEEQTRRVARRARLIRLTLLCLLATIGCLTLCSLVTGISVLWPPAIYAAVGLFIVGLLLLLSGVVLAMLELKGALDPVELESEFVARLTEHQESAGAQDAA